MHNIVLKSIGAVAKEERKKERMGCLQMTQASGTDRTGRKERECVCVCACMCVCLCVCVCVCACACLDVHG